MQTETVNLKPLTATQHILKSGHLSQQSIPAQNGKHPPPADIGTIGQAVDVVSEFANRRQRILSDQVQNNGFRGIGIGGCCLKRICEIGGTPLFVSLDHRNPGEAGYFFFSSPSGSSPKADRASSIDE